MNIDTRTAGDVQILDCRGSLTLGRGTKVLHDAVLSSLKTGRKAILLNLKEVDYVDSGGIGELVSSLTTAMRQGGNLKLVNVSRKVQDVLSLAKAIDLFELHYDEETALQSFTKAGSSNSGR